MAKAILGTFAGARSYQLLDEIRSLRERVAELEAALARAETALAENGGPGGPSGVTSAEEIIELEAEVVSA